MVVGRETVHDAEYLHKKLGSLLAVWKVEEQWTAEWQTTGLTGVLLRQEAVGRDFAVAELVVTWKMEVQWTVE